MKESPPGRTLPWQENESSIDRRYGNYEEMPGYFSDGDDVGQKLVQYDTGVRHRMLEISSPLLGKHSNQLLDIRSQKLIQNL